MAKYILGVFLSLLLGVNLAVAEVVVSEPSFKAVLPGKTLTSGYMVLTNTGDQDVRLVNVRSAYTSSIEMHTIIDVGERKGMRRVKGVAIPAGDNVAFKTGGLHLMMFGVKSPLPDTIDIELCFDDETTQTVSYKKVAW